VVVKNILGGNLIHIFITRNVFVVPAVMDLNINQKMIIGKVNGSGKMGCVITWCWEDIKELKPRWTKEKCQKWLDRNSERIIDRSVEEGWEIIRALLDKP
jgi:hypothetical protein